MISVCMATYNGAKYIKEQVDSILHQLGATDELVISDDGSTDETLNLLRSYRDDRIKIFTNNNRKGVVGNFENALKQSQGDYLFLSDQDDLWLDGKVEICVEALQKADLVMHDAIVVDALGSQINNSFYSLRGSKKGYWNNLIKNSFLGCCLAFRKEVLSYTLPIPKVAMHDIWIGLMVSRKGQVTLIDTPLLKYRRHGQNASPTGEKSNLTTAYKLSYRLKLLLFTSFK